MLLQMNADAGKAIYEINQNEIFNCDISTEKQCESITSNLLDLLEMIIYGVLSNENTWKQIVDVALSIAELICYRTIKHRRVESATIVCHIAKNEPPFPVMMEMVVYAIAISKSLVDFHSWHGLSPGYQRIKWIRCLNSHHICDIYSELDHVCPPSLQDSVFTLVTIDNVYHVLLSATTKQPLHGTTISDEQNSKKKSENQRLSSTPRPIWQKQSLSQNHTQSWRYWYHQERKCLWIRRYLAETWYKISLDFNKKFSISHVIKMMISALFLMT